jgi:hypothetical protein
LRTALRLTPLQLYSDPRRSVTAVSAATFWTCIIQLHKKALLLLFQDIFYQSKEQSSAARVTMCVSQFVSYIPVSRVGYIVRVSVRELHSVSRVSYGVRDSVCELVTVSVTQFVS